MKFQYNSTHFLKHTLHIFCICTQTIKHSAYKHLNSKNIQNCIVQNHKLEGNTGGQAWWPSITSFGQHIRDQARWPNSRPSFCWTLQRSSFAGHNRDQTFGLYSSSFPFKCVSPNLLRISKWQKKITPGLFANSSQCIKSI